MSLPKTGISTSLPARGCEGKRACVDSLLCVAVHITVVAIPVGSVPGCSQCERCN